MYALAAGLVNIEQRFPGNAGSSAGTWAVHIDIVMVKIERDLKIIGHAVLELLAEIDDAVVTMLSFPACGDPLLEFNLHFRRNVSCVSPCEDRSV
jgi:hypothetical protein